MNLCASFNNFVLFTFAVVLVNIPQSCIFSQSIHRGRVIAALITSLSQWCYQRSIGLSTPQSKVRPEQRLLLISVSPVFSASGGSWLSRLFKGGWQHWFYHPRPTDRRTQRGSTSVQQKPSLISCFLVFWHFFKSVHQLSHFAALQNWHCFFFFMMRKVCTE